MKRRASMTKNARRMISAGIARPVCRIAGAMIRLAPAPGLAARSCSGGQEFASGSFGLRLAASA